MNRPARIVAFVLGLVAAGLGLSCRTGADATKLQAERAASLTELLAAEDASGFVVANAPRTFEFPADHGAHEGFRTEWWYFTGNLETGGGRHFGYQLTFFRSQLTPEPAERSSAWGTAALFMAHFALTDTAAGEFHSFERFAREGLDLAGAAAEPFRVHLEDWQVTADQAGQFPGRLEARGDDVTLSLDLEATRQPILQGDAGLSYKSAGGSSASYYYSMPRIDSHGEVTIGDDRFTVGGFSWLDREWSSGVLNPRQVGWDWVALSLEDGRDLTAFQLRRADGSVDWAGGSIAAPGGATRSLAPGDLTMTPLARWRSARSGASYPVRWRLEVPQAEVDLEIEALLDDQEHTGSFAYWEGAVAASPRGSDQRIGLGYLELTGYRPADGASAD